MAFSTQSSITSENAFLTALVAFAVAEAGFTDHGIDSGGTENLYRISKTVDTVQTWYGFRKEDVGTSAQHSDVAIAGRMMLELPTDTNFDTVNKGQRYKTFMGLYNIAPTWTGYSFFSDGVTVFAVLELTTGVFTHMNFGNVTKTSAWAGGAFLTANNFQTEFSGTTWFALDDSFHSLSSMILAARSNTPGAESGAGYLRYNIGGADNSDFTAFGGNDHGSDGSLLGASGTVAPNNTSVTSAASAGEFFIGLNVRMLNASPSESTFIAPLFPVNIFRQHSVGAPDKAVPLGHIPNIASLNVSLLNDKELTNTDWRVFPITTQVDDDQVASFSKHYGVAYKEIP